jgi:hypothetical protein
MSMISRAVPARTFLAAITPALIALAVGSCSPAQSPPSATGDNNCNFVNYRHDEAKNTAGPGKCSSDCDCDGMRTCSFDHSGKVGASGTCQGTARPEGTGPAVCNNKDYHWNEAWSPQGPGRCANDCECDGLRTCTAGACQGTAR